MGMRAWCPLSLFLSLVTLCVAVTFKFRETKTKKIILRTKCAKRVCGGASPAERSYARTGTCDVCMRVCV